MSLALQARTPKENAMKAYESELSGFLRTLKQQPQIEARQREGRALWWDRQLDADELQRWQASRCLLYTSDAADE